MRARVVLALGIVLSGYGRYSRVAAHATVWCAALVGSRRGLPPGPGPGDVASPCIEPGPCMRGGPTKSGK